MSNNVINLTHEELIYRLHYSPETGFFTWRNPAAPWLKLGDKAGTVNEEGYLRVKINYRFYYGHRLIWFYMTGKWPSNQIDHVNGDKTDNRWENLRLASQNQNQRNKVTYKNNVSGEKGVSWHKASALWRARVVKNNKGYESLHRYYWQAVRAARKMREKLHGEYCRHY